MNPLPLLPKINTLAGNTLWQSISHDFPSMPPCPSGDLNEQR
jgi:hypothetical protein